ncbi:hypothetical protein BJX76DRAFT_78 [Aspergillus varians]
MVGTTPTGSDVEAFLLPFSAFSLCFGFVLNGPGSLPAHAFLRSSSDKNKSICGQGMKKCRSDISEQSERRPTCRRAGKRKMESKRTKYWR